MVYFGASLLLAISDVTSPQPTDGVTFFFKILPLVFVDSIFYWWIFLALLQTIAKLSQRKQTAKQVMYINFFSILVVIAVLTALGGIVQVLLAGINGLDKIWYLQQGFTIYWCSLQYLLVSTIVFIWRPTNNTLMSYSELLDEPDEGIVLTPLPQGDAVLRHTTITQASRDNKDPTQEVIQLTLTDFAIDLLDDDMISTKKD